MSADGTTGKLLLCDAAQVQGGKLFILGGGWARVIAIGPLTMALAIYLRIPWHAANQPKRLSVDLVDADGHPIPDPDGQPIRAEGGIEVGRPPGLRAGTSLDSCIAITINQLALGVGVYRWELHLDEELLDDAVFEVLAPPPGLLIPGGMIPAQPPG
jgi:hypothetical protein